MLIVLALLLVASSLVFPPVLRLMADQPLKEAAERARAQLAYVRLKALDSSIAWQFRFEPGGRRYLWMPLEQSSVNAAPASFSNVATAPTTSTTTTTTTTDSNSSPQTAELPKGIFFAADSNGMPFGVEHLPPEMVAGLSNSYELAQVGWSRPLAFQPDGSASDLELAVIDARDRQIRLTVRGLTGGVTVFSMQTRRRP